MLARKIVGAGVTAAGVGFCAFRTKKPADCAGPIGYPPAKLADSLKDLPDWIKGGCGNAEYYCPEKGAVFPGDECPTLMPDLSKHNNFMAEVLRENPGMYDRLKHRKTSMGVTLAKCMKTGVDNPGHPAIKTVGLVAGDEESYFTFKELFDPVIDARHGGYKPNAKHPTNLDLDQVSKRKLDPYGKYVLTSRVRTGRSVKGTRLPPACSFEERRELERIIVKGLMNLSGDLKGDYYPLAGSYSYAPKLGGMSHAKEENLRSKGNLFQEPDSTLLLASGCGRHWPDARGIFHNDAENCFVWVNEEDQMRIVSMQKGDDVQAVFARFINLCDGVQKVLKQEGYDFMHNDHHGFVLTCPSNLGTGLRAGTMVNLPKLSARPDWKKLMGAMKLQARGTGGVDSASSGGCWDVSNADRIGKGEVDLVNILIEGAAKLVKWEGMLDAGNGAAVDAEIKAVMG
jgi:creatine kinase